jgi:hypothetical protein
MKKMRPLKNSFTANHISPVMQRTQDKGARRGAARPLHFSNCCRKIHNRQPPGWMSA